MKTLPAIVATLLLFGGTHVIGQDPMPTWASIHLYVLFRILVEVPS